jgi:hypothetical protein
LLSTYLEFQKDSTGIPGPGFEFGPWKSNKKILRRWRHHLCYWRNGWDWSLCWNRKLSVAIFLLIPFLISCKGTSISEAQTHRTLQRWRPGKDRVR